MLLYCKGHIQMINNDCLIKVKQKTINRLIKITKFNTLPIYITIYHISTDYYFLKDRIR